MPLAFQLWPDNWYVVPAFFRTFQDVPNWAAILNDQSHLPVQFYQTVEAPDSNLNLVEREDTLEHFFDTLFVQEERSGLAPTARPVSANSEAFTSSLSRWGYNDFTVDMTAPATGWVMLHLLYDPLWRATVDGQRATLLRANVFCTAVPICQGRHVLKLSYWPLSRRLFWPACWLLEGTLLVLGTAVLLSRQRSPIHSRAPQRVARAGHPAAIFRSYYG
jgi:hypothetical protein